MNGNSSRMPLTKLTEAEHRAKIESALLFFDMSPWRLEWHYVQMVFKALDRNVSATARCLGMHRRSLQRILTKREPQ